jgi:hypothetical protein
MTYRTDSNIDHRPPPCPVLCSVQIDQQPYKITHTACSFVTSSSSTMSLAHDLGCKVGTYMEVTNRAFAKIASPKCIQRMHAS